MKSALIVLLLAAAMLWQTQAASSFALSATYRDGTPDFLHLHDPADRDAFRRWFIFLAEVEYFTAPANRPREITDCSSLLRFAYREALRSHDARWAAAANLPLVPALPSVQQYAYPHTPLGPSLFRLRPGLFTPEDLHNGAFAQFASAETLRRYNTFFVSRDVSRARPGDLLFYFRPGRSSPSHSMIFIGRSQIQPSSASFVIYDTGPDATIHGRIQGSETQPGEVRRRTLDELLQYPDTQWQPRSANPFFRGVFRWNILRSDSF